MPLADISGIWSYRAFHNNADIGVPFNDLRFATARLDLRVSATVLTGSLRGEGWGTWTEWGLALTGTYADGAFAFRGENMINGETWVYDYRGTLLTPWSHATDPKPVLAGSVIRTAGREKHDALAGLSATFIAVKRDM